MDRATIIVNGLVQGVGFRYFILRKASSLGLKGFTKNLYTGEVLTIVEGNKESILELYEQLKLGPSHSNVRNHSISWEEFANEFSTFEIKH